MKTLVAHALAIIIVGAFIAPPLYLALLFAAEMGLNIPQMSLIVVGSVLLSSMYLSIVTRTKRKFET